MSRAGAMSGMLGQHDLCSQDAKHADGVADLAAQACFIRLAERQAPQREALRAFRSRLTKRQVPREVNVARLRADAGRQVERTQQVPPRRRDARLFRQLAPRRFRWLFAVLHLAAGNGPLVALERIAKIAHEIQVLVAVQRDNRSVIAGIDHTIDAPLAIWTHHRILDHLQPRIAIHLPCAERAPGAARRIVSGYISLARPFKPHSLLHYLRTYLAMILALVSRCLDMTRNG